MLQTRSGGSRVWYTEPVDLQTWTTISRLLDEALELPPAARTTWLDGLSAEYEAFKPRLREMLDQAARSGDAAFLDTLPKLREAALSTGGEGPFPGADRAGTMVGPYRLVRELASGGQGSVWLAERPDGLVNRPVAIKLPIGLAYRPDLADRLARERGILASLTHPHIARLYDAGVTDAGEPFLALEYVEGTTLDRHTEAHGLGIEERIRLFLQVARAVAFAHARLVIHRDLKPSNVLVTPAGEVRLLDFGIAKLLDAAPPNDSTLTEVGGRAMTLQYASPEQVLRAPLGVATDIYSLGVMLYELVAGCRPYRPARDTVAALEDSILHDDPAPPSLRATTPRARKILRGDLDTIVLKALKKTPEDRYRTVDALSDDLERYLTGRPVLAQPDSRWYRARKLVARNRLAVAAAAAVLVAILAGTGVAWWQARVARAEAARAETVKEFIASTLRDANLDAEPGAPVTVLALLERAHQRLESLPAGEVKAELLVVLGDALLSLGDTDALEAVATDALNESRALGPDHPLSFRSHMLMARVHMYRGRPAEMRAELDAVTPALNVDPVAHAEELALVWRLRADAALDLGQYDEAEAAAREALRRTEALAPGSENTVNALGVLTDALRRTGKRDEALAAAERATRLAEEFYATDPRHPQVIHARARYARALGDAGQLSVAVAELERILDDAIAVFGPDGRTVAFHLQNLANFQLRLGRLHDAVSSIRRGRAIIEHHSAPGSPTIGAFDNTAGAALLAARRPAEAVGPLTSARDAAIKAFGPTHVNTLNARASLALATWLAGHQRDAADEVDRIMADMRATGRDFTRPLQVAGIISRLNGADLTAAALLRRAEAASGGDRGDLAQIRTQQGLVGLSQGTPQRARELFEEAIGLFADQKVEFTPARADALIGLARAHLRLGRADLALSPIEDAHRFWQGFDAGSPDAREAALWRGRILAAQQSTGPSR